MGSKLIIVVFAVVVIGGWLLARGAEAAHALLGQPGADNHADADFWSAKVHTTRHYMAHVMVEAATLSQTVTCGAETTLSLADHQF